MNFIHTADWQLGKPFASVDDPDKAAKLRSERIEVIKRIGKIASELKTDFVLVAGDLFDSFTADKSTVSATCGALAEIKVPIIAIPGNHDHGGPGCLWEQDFFRSERESLASHLQVVLSPEPFNLDQATVFPCPLLRRHQSTDPTAWIRDFDFDSLTDTDKPRLVLAHGSVHGFDSSGSDEENETLGTPNLIALDRLPLNEIDYVALGDWHGTKEVSASAWYAGTPEIDRFPKGEENNPGNILHVSVERGQKPRVEVVPTTGLHWHSLEFNFVSDDDLGTLGETLSEATGDRVREDLIHLILNGSLGMNACNRLDQLLDTWESRLLRLKRKQEIRIAPTEEEIESLTQRAADPLIAQVALRLLEDSAKDGENSELTHVALRELYAALQ
ncbi:MAG: DNA repair exonuclease [Verrucomicrobiota bacterium]